MLSTENTYMYRYVKNVQQINAVQPWNFSEMLSQSLYILCPWFLLHKIFINRSQGVKILLKYYCTIKKQHHALRDIQSYKTKNWLPITPQSFILFICLANLLTYINILGAIYISPQSHGVY